MPSLERAMERMYGDISLTDELTDDVAEVLLDWGAAEHEKLADADLDEEAFEERAKAVRKAMNRINSFMGGRSGYDDEKARDVMARFTEGVYDLGYEVPMTRVETFLSEMDGKDDMTVLRELLVLIDPPLAPVTADALAVKPDAAGSDPALDDTRADASPDADTVSSDVPDATSTDDDDESDDTASDASPLPGLFDYLFGENDEQE